MGFGFKKLKNLFVTEVEDSNQNKDSGKDVKKEGSDSKDILEMLKNKDKTPVSDENVPLSGKPDPKIMDSLIQALDDSNLPGEDYMEFAEALKAMETIQLDEQVKVQTVLATLSSRGLTKEKILESGAYYIGVLEKEKQKFGHAMEKQIKETVTARQDDIVALEELNKTKAIQIATLTKEITDNQQEIEKIKSKIAETEVKIKSTEANFVLSYEFIVRQLQANIDKIPGQNPPPAK